MMVESDLKMNYSCNEYFKNNRIMPEHPSVVERYFENLYFIPKENHSKFKDPVSDQCVLVHSNKIILITLAPNHPVIKERKKILKIDFHSNHIDNKVNGKQKKGGLKLKENTILCKIYCSDEKIYTVLSCIKSSLIEINDNLISNPQLLVTKTWTDGHIAILLPYLKTFEKNKSNLLTLEEYKKKLIN